MRLRLLLALAATLAAPLGLSPASASAYTFGPDVTQLGPEQIVYDYSTTACDRLDIPDTTANAFRDSSGRVQLHSSVYTGRRFIGPSLTDMQHECRALINSHFDPEPANYQDAEWIGSTYTEDGDRSTPCSATSTRDGCTQASARPRLRITNAG